MDKIDYRKLYKEKLNIEFDNSYEIHHLDLNHQNNSFDNLLLLPKSLHQEYHKALDEIKPINNDSLIFRITSILDIGNGYNHYAINKLLKFVEVYSKCQKLADYKNFLEGKIPNIHGIDISNGSV